VNAPPKVGDKVVLGDWHQFKSTVSLVEDEAGGNVAIHITMEYPDDPYFSRSKETVKVFLHDEGSSWHRWDSYPRVN